MLCNSKEAAEELPWHGCVPYIIKKLKVNQSSYGFIIELLDMDLKQRMSGKGLELDDVI